MAKKVLIINGSYRTRGFTDQMLDIMRQRLEAEGVETETVLLRDTPIDFCGNCRSCTQGEGTEPGRCVLDDGMGELITKIEAADGYIFASPTNFNTVTALFKRFIERLVVYGYWPWGAPAPEFRKAAAKAALCVTSCAAPSLIGRFAYNTLKVLKHAARCVGADVVDTLMVGLVSREAHVAIGEKDRQRILKVASKLLKTVK